MKPVKIGKVHIEVMKYLQENGAKGGRIGGRSKSLAKQTASRANGAKAKKQNDFITELQKEHERVRIELDEVKLHYGKVFTENENLRDENADLLLKIEDLKEALSPFALFASALDGFDPTKSVRTIGVQGIRVSAFNHASEVLSLHNAQGEPLGANN